MPTQNLLQGLRLATASESVLILLAPFRFTYKGSENRDVVFQGEDYVTNTTLTASYKFNSYRATYFYYLTDRENLTLGLGLSLKTRDALIGLKVEVCNPEKPILVLCL